MAESAVLHSIQIQEHANSYWRKSNFWDSLPAELLEYRGNLDNPFHMKNLKMMEMHNTSLHPRFARRKPG